ncbi:hypothetical protein F0U61_23975 [Archangium violaceum]|nr:hypothetical protein F0U61_23975 [Archangium violaceum]
MGELRARTLAPYLSVALSLMLLSACVTPGQRELQPSHREMPRPEANVRMSPLPDGRLRLDFPLLVPNPTSQQFSVELAREVLAEYHEALVRVRSQRQLPVAGERAPRTRQGTWGEWWLREQFLEGFGPSPFPLPETLEGSSLLLALSLSPRYMPEGMREAAVQLFADPAFLAGVATALVFYGLAWIAPEPFFTKAFAVSVTVTLALAFSVAELAHFGMVCLRLYQDTRGARTREEIEAAAERFGRYLGGVGLRVLVYVASRGVSRALPKPPPGGLLARLAPRRFSMAGGPDLGSATAVRAVAADGSLVIAGVAAGATGQNLHSACKDGSISLARHTWHHLATNKNAISLARGGPWTPLFQVFFDKAGMSLDAPENKVYLEGHVGPHPEAYHEEVFRRLTDAMDGCRTRQECRSRLVEELGKIASEVCTPGSRLHRLLTNKP